MPKGKQLTAAFLRNVRTPGKHHDNMGAGLYLLVDENGSRRWVQRLTVRKGKRVELGLGGYPLVSLLEAREKAIENKRLVRAGLDPREEKAKRRAAITFAEAAHETYREVAPTLKNPKDRAAFLNTLETYVFPAFGDKPLSDVTSADVRGAVLQARDKVPSVAKKLIYRTSRVFKWGIAEGHCENNPAVSDALALPRNPHVVQHFKAMPYREVAGFLDELWSCRAELSTKLAIEFIILTGTRSGEAREALWKQFDFHGASDVVTAKAATWNIPASDMKMGRPHRVPISLRVLQLLRIAETLRDDHGFVFPGRKEGRPLSDMTLSKLVKSLGFDFDVHGFRTSFRTWVQEQTDYAWEIGEAAISHKVGNAVEAAYARSDVLEKRRTMMEEWASYICDGRKSLEIPVIAE